MSDEHLALYEATRLAGAIFMASLCLRRHLLRRLYAGVRMLQPFTFHAEAMDLIYIGLTLVLFVLVIGMAAGSHLLENKK